MAAPIGILDSGVGGLSVTAEIFKQLPFEEILYFGDTANLPYGEKTPEQIKQLVFSIIEFFVANGVKAIVMACNSSTAIVMEEALKIYNMPIIGVIEPAIKEALRIGKTEEVGLFANAVTVASGAHQKILSLFSGNGARIIGKACPKLVPLVEKGLVTGKETEDAICEYINDIKNSSADTLILGCTHYPFLSETIKKIAGDGIKIVDPALETASRLREVLTTNHLLNPEGTHVRHRFMVSGNPDSFRILGSKLLGFNIDNVMHHDNTIPITAGKR